MFSAQQLDPRHRDQDSPRGTTEPGRPIWRKRACLVSRLVQYVVNKTRSLHELIAVLVGNILYKGCEIVHKLEKEHVLKVDNN